jgi:hypothetical protein
MNRQTKRRASKAGQDIEATDAPTEQGPPEAIQVRIGNPLLGQLVLVAKAIGQTTNPGAAVAFCIEAGVEKVRKAQDQRIVLAKPSDVGRIVGGGR